MSDQTQLLMEIHRSVGSLEEGLNGLRGEISGVKADVKAVKDQGTSLQLGQARLEERLGGLPCGLHSAQIHELRTDIKEVHGEVQIVDAKVDNLLTRDIPAIQRQLVVLDWWQSHRNKAFAVLAVTILGVLAAIVGDFVKDALFHTADAAPATQQQHTTPPPQEPLSLPGTQG